MACAIGAAGTSVSAQGTAPSIPVMPMPEHVQTGSSMVSVEGGFSVSFEGYTEPRLEHAKARFLAQFRRETGVLAWPAAGPSVLRLTIHTGGPSEKVERLGEDESYHLEVTESGITLRAPNPLGVLHGLQTLLQLVQQTGKGFAIPAVTIDDKPRFPWRGLMIDSGRHFIPLSEIKQNIDLMEASKLNVFHWHLSDDQGFRVESTTFPLLQQKGSDGLYYTQAEVRDLIDYARERGIRVVPEFDMPGHATSWFVGYPNLASGAGPYSIDREWGVRNPAMDPTRESTYQFLDRFLAEMTALFPDAYFHVGGDECNGKEWDANPRIQTFMREHQFKNDAELQAYFTGRVQKLVTAHHKITIGWDEVLQPGTPKDVVIQSWRGQESLATAAKQGNRAFLSWGYYLDLNQPASQHYAVDPLGSAAAALTPEQQKLILGGETAMWTEYVDADNLNRRNWPRAAAVAERLWSPQDMRDTASMYARLEIFSQHLGWYGLAPAPIDDARLQRLLGSEDTAHLAVLASVVEPPKNYTREAMKHNTAYSPLNHLVDVVPAESREAREFRELAEKLAAGKGTPEDFNTARAWLTKWRDNDSALQPQLARYALAAELAPLSRNLSQAATIGLAALSSLQGGKAGAGADEAQQLASLKTLGAPQAVLLDQVIPGIETLVRASAH